MAMALDLIMTRRILSLPYKLDRIIDFDFFGIMGSNKENVLHASAPHVLYVSTAKGVHRHLSSEHLACIILGVFTYLCCFGC